MIYTIPIKASDNLTKQLIQYMWCTRRKKLFRTKESRSENKLTGITDASHANQDGLQSQLGHFITMNKKLLGGRSSKARITCTSSTEAEVYAIAETIPRLENLRMLLQVIYDKETVCEIKSDRQPGMSAIESGDFLLNSYQFCPV